METSLAIALTITLIAGLLLIRFNSVSSPSAKYRKMIEAVRFDTETVLTEEELTRRLQTLHLDHYRTKLYPLLRQEIVYKIEPCPEDTLKTGASRTGGRPDLPPDTVIAEDLFFLAQFNCQDLKQNDKQNLFPNKGMLYFFLNPHNKRLNRPDTVRVYYNSSSDNLVSRTDIAPLPDIIPGQICFFQAVSLPQYDTDIIQNMLHDYEMDGYFKMTNREQCHKLLGYPDTITDNFDLGEDKVLLMQSDSDSAVGLQWGNMGRLFVFIDKDKLRRLQFDETETFVQSYE
ncbi:MAG: DUF1963 domain-containing protein [Bacteroidales bacterium]|jgi:uncharacterized protein YwqG|nr:DUF1963 domain-containing protein [Bacteroidales bacterium]